MATWYCRLEGNPIGPIDTLTLKTLGETGRIKPDDEVSLEPDGPWSRADQVNGLRFRTSENVSAQALAPAPANAAPSQTPLHVQYEYKMAQLAPMVEVVPGQSNGRDAADHLQELVALWANKGWEFWRVDEFLTSHPPGCLEGLFGAKKDVVRHYVATFRRLVK